MDVTIIRPGLQTTVQDLGRPGYRAAGVPLGGAMDRVALRLANLLVGNPENAPALEFALLGPELHFPADALVAVTGADFGVLPPWHPVRLPAGTTLRLAAARSGCRGYLAVAGGFSVPAVLGGAGVCLRAGFGGRFGRALREGDVLVAPDVSRAVAPGWSIDRRLLPPYSRSPEVRVVRGAQASQFGSAFLDAPFAVTAQSDRMGVRLKGPRLTRNVNADIRSAAVAPGTIQVPPDGQPIILMADAQTIGGYPQIAHVITVDLPLVAQLRPGDTVNFREVRLEDAHQAAIAREHAVAMLRHGLAQKVT